MQRLECETRLHKFRVHLPKKTIPIIFTLQNGVREAGSDFAQKRGLAWLGGLQKVTASDLSVQTHENKLFKTKSVRGLGTTNMTDCNPKVLGALGDASAFGVSSVPRDGSGLGDPGDGSVTRFVGSLRTLSHPQLACPVQTRHGPGILRSQSFARSQRVHSELRELTAARATVMDFALHAAAPGLVLTPHAAANGGLALHAATDAGLGHLALHAAAHVPCGAREWVRLTRRTCIGSGRLGIPEAKWQNLRADCGDCISLLSERCRTEVCLDRNISCHRA